jgi:hypothetical protein
MQKIQKIRKSKKVLKFRKFKVANLQASGVIGGTDSNPCVATGPGPEGLSLQVTDCHTDDCCTQANSDCSIGQYLSDENDRCDLSAPSKYC